MEVVAERGTAPACNIPLLRATRGEGITCAWLVAGYLAGVQYRVSFAFVLAGEPSACNLEAMAVAEAAAAAAVAGLAVPALDAQEGCGEPIPYAPGMQMGLSLLGRLLIAMKPF